MKIQPHRTALGFLFLLLLVGCRSSESPPPVLTPTASPASSDIEAPVLLALGDSLTEGLGVEESEAYPALLEEYLQSEGLSWRVQNAGVSGETSSGALSRLEWVLRTEPDAVLIVIGGNDGLRGIDPEVTKANIASMLRLLQEKQIPVLLGGMQAPGNLGPDYTEAFEAIYPTVAKSLEVPLIPFFLEGVAAVPELNQPDRIHPTAEGYQEIVERIGPQVVEWLRPLSRTRANSAP